MGTTFNDAADRSGLARTFAVCLTTIFSIAVSAAGTGAGATIGIGAGAAADGTGGAWGGEDAGAAIALGRSVLTIEAAGVDELTATGAEFGFGRARFETGP